MPDKSDDAKVDKNGLIEEMEADHAAALRVAQQTPGTVRCSVKQKGNRKNEHIFKFPYWLRFVMPICQ